MQLMDSMFIAGLARMPLGMVESWGMPVVASLAIVPTALAAALYFGFMQRRPELKNSAYIPLLLGAIMGVVAFVDFNRPGVRDFGDFGRKSLFLFVAMWALPAIAAVALAVYDKFGTGGGRRANY